MNQDDRTPLALLDVRDGIVVDMYQVLIGLIHDDPIKKLLSKSISISFGRLTRSICLPNEQRLSGRGHAADTN